MIRYTKLLFLAFFVLFHIGAGAQNVMLFTSKQGLSYSCVRNMFEDSRHNIWVTTQNGLNRYDGVKMNVYRHVIGDEHSLVHDESTCVFEYDSLRMLVGTGHGLQMFDYASDKFQTIHYIGERGDTLIPRVVSINKLKDKIYVSFAGYGQVELLTDGEDNYSLKHINDYDEEGHAPLQMVDEGNGRLWILSDARSLFLRLNGKTRKFSDLPEVVRICRSSSGRLYAATRNHGLFVYDKSAERFTLVAEASEFGRVIENLSPWTLGRLFISTDGAGLLIYDENTDKVTLSAIKTNDFDLSTANVKDAMSDTYGNVWVAIYWKGVMMKPVNQSAFEYIGQNSITKNSIGDKTVFAMVPDDKGIWVATDNDGIYHITPDGLSSQHWTGQSGSPGGYTAIARHGGMTLLLGSFTEGLWQFDDGRFSLITMDINKVFDIKPAKEKGCYWIATLGDGFYYFDYASKNYVKYAPDWSDGGIGTKIIGNPYVFKILPVGNRLFVGTADGVTICKIDHGGTITRESDKILIGKTVSQLTVSDDGKTVWAATNNGLAAIDIASLQTKVYTTEDGLPINSIKSVLTDGKKLWLGTDLGLSCFVTDEGKFINFSAADGIQDNEFSTAAAKYNGNLYLGGIGGITYFESKRIEQWQNTGAKMHLKLVDVYVGGRKVHKGDESGSYDILEGLINECERIDLSHNDNHFTIELCVPELASQNIRYEYSVNGGPWTSQDGNNSRLVFDNLDAGTYKVRVRATAMGEYTEERTFFAVVHPAWYASTFAKIIYTLLFLAACWLAYQYARRKIEVRKALAKQKQQEELNEARIRFFMNISHEIRTPMTLIMSPLNKLIDSDNDPERQHNYKLIKQNSNRILRLVNQMMDARKIEQGKFLLNYKKVELVEFVQNIVDVFATNAQSRNIQYEFVHNQDIYNVYVDPSNTDKIVMNLLSNAFKFTPDGGKITVRLMAREKDFDLIVDDSGCGISDADKLKVFDRFYSAGNKDGYIGTGIGLNLTSMLVKLHKGEIHVEDNPEGQGTRMAVTMPVGDSSLVGGSIVPDDEKNETEHEISELLTIDKPTDTHRKNLILVEDDEAIRQYVHSELSKDLVIKTCSNGQEAWDYIVTHPGKVDIVLSDIMMPVMDGLTLCQKIKTNFNTNHIPVVLMTALGSDSDRIAGLTNGADAYVTKPFNIDVLRTVVVQQLKTRQMLQGKFHGDKQQEEKIKKIEVESPDENLMRRVMKVVNEQISNPDLSVEMIADKVGISRVHFYRKMKDLTGQAPRDFLKYIRLKEAGRLLKEKKLDITGVSIATGFKSLSAFSTNFKSLYGLSPTEYVKKMEEEGEE